MIGVFDSGLGGLSVLDALVTALPRADITYFADTAHVPYGNKEDHFIQERVLHIGSELVGQGCRLLVVACNTATAAAVESLRRRFPNVPVVGVEPGVKPAAHASRSRRIAILATESTARSDRLARLIRDHAGHCNVHVEACPGWATRVEHLQLHGADLEADARGRLTPLLDAGVDQVVLGCTHYGFLRPLLESVTAGRAELVDVASAVAQQARRLARDSAEGHGRLRFEASAAPERVLAALPALGLQRLAARTELAGKRG